MKCILQVDFIEVVKRKRALLEDNPDMLAMIGELSKDMELISPHVGKQSQLFYLHLYMQSDHSV